MASCSPESSGVIGSPPSSIRPWTPPSARLRSLEAEILNAPNNELWTKLGLSSARDEASFIAGAAGRPSAGVLDHSVSCPGRGCCVSFSRMAKQQLRVVDARHFPLRAANEVVVMETCLACGRIAIASLLHLFRGEVHPCLSQRYIASATLFVYIASSWTFVCIACATLFL